MPPLLRNRLTSSMERRPSSRLSRECAVFLPQPEWNEHMGKKLYVGNLAFATTEADLERLFGAFGTVVSAQVIMDRDTGRSKGFGFVEMGTDQEAQAAIAGLNNKESDGRTLTVNEARPKESGGGRGGFGGGGGGGGRGGRGGPRRY